MYLPNAVNEGLDSILATVQRNTADLISKLNLESKPNLYKRGSDLVELARKEGNLYLLTSGQLELTLNDKALLVYEQGDLIGVESLLPISCCTLAEDFAVEAVAIPLPTIEEKLGARAVLALISDFSALFMTALACNMPQKDSLDPEMRRYEVGEVIVEQGSFGDDIYTLVEGHADVFVDGSKVGEVKTDEVFGALAAMTNIGRTATIVSSGNALVLSLKKDRLLELIKLRPGTIEKLIGDLARVIQDQNKRLAERG